MSRHEARQAALEALYESDQRNAPPDATGLSRRAEELVQGVWEERQSLDEAIGEASLGWRVARMPPVDRNVLRIALWELRHKPETPVAVVISEAVRIAKAYSTSRSGGFVNGVLAKLAAGRRGDE